MKANWPDFKLQHHTSREKNASNTKQPVIVPYRPHIIYYIKLYSNIIHQKTYNHKNTQHDIEDMI